MGKSEVNGKKKMNPALRVCLTILVALIALVVVLAIVVACVWNKEIKTISSIQKISPSSQSDTKPVYYMEYEGDFWFDDFISQGGVSCNEDLLNFIVGKLSRGLYTPNMEKGDMKLGCTTFTSQTADSSWLYARNYDFAQAPVCILKTNPGNGKHKTLSVLDTSKFGVSLKDSNDLSLKDKFMLLASPYATMDGMNDAGVSVAILMTRQGKDFSNPEAQGIGTDIYSDKMDLTASSFQRTILEQASSVEDAIKIAENCDMHEFENSSFHYHVADASGKSAIIEWAGTTNDTDKDPGARKINITYPNAGDNFQVASNYITKAGYYPGGIPYGFDRYINVYNKLSPSNGIVSNVDEAMNILSGVGRKTHASEFAGDVDEVTLWSVVYDLTNKTMTLIDNEMYSDPAHKIEYTLD